MRATGSVVRDTGSLDLAVSGCSRLDRGSGLSASRLKEFLSVGSRVTGATSPGIVTELGSRRRELERGSKLSGRRFTRVLELGRRLVRGMPRAGTAVASRKGTVTRGADGTGRCGTRRLRLVHLRLRTREAGTRTGVSRCLRSRDEVGSGVGDARRLVGKLGRRRVSRASGLQKLRGRLTSTGIGGSVTRRRELVRAVRVRGEGLRNVGGRRTSRTRVVLDGAGRLSGVRSRVKGLSRMGHGVISVRLRRTKVGTGHKRRVITLSSTVSGLRARGRGLRGAAPTTRGGARRCRQSINTVRGRVGGLGAMGDQVKRVAKRTRGVGGALKSAVCGSIIVQRGECTLIATPKRSKEVPRKLHRGKNPMNAVPGLRMKKLTSHLVDTPLRGRVSMELLHGRAMLARTRRTGLFE